MIGLHPGQVRLAFPVSGALVLGVGVGSAIGWMAGGADPATTSQHQAVAVASTTMASMFTTSAMSGQRRSGPNQDPVALELLERAATVQTTLAWSGTQVVTTWSSQGTTTRMVDLSHEPGEGTAARVYATAADKADVTFVPDADAPEASPDGDSPGPLAILTRTYALRLGSKQEIAGRPAEEVLAYRSDDTVAARFWMDRSTGLLLRRELVDPSGWVTHSSLFVDVNPGQSGDLVAGADVTRPWTTELTHQQLDAMPGASWACPDELPGGLMLYDIRRTPSTTDPVIHLAYSDGLVNVSVFEERGHLAKSATRGFVKENIGGRIVQAREGTSQEVTWESGGTVYTVLADAPQTSLAAVIASLPSPTNTSGHSGWSRVRRGLDRIGSWVNPRG